MSGEKRNLPRPTSVSDLYLAAILDELGAIRSQLGPAPSQEGETVELREPLSLPTSFPGVRELQEAGITLLQDVPRSMIELRKIHGIGPKTAREIMEALS